MTVEEMAKIAGISNEELAQRSGFSVEQIGEITENEGSLLYLTAHARLRDAALDLAKERSAQH